MSTGRRTGPLARSKGRPLSATINPASSDSRCAAGRSARSITCIAKVAGGSTTWGGFAIPQDVRGAKNLVSADDLVEALLEGSNVELAHETHRDRGMMRWVARLQPLKQPEALLHG